MFLRSFLGPKKQTLLIFGITPAGKVKTMFMEGGVCTRRWKKVFKMLKCPQGNKSKDEKIPK